MITNTPNSSLVDAGAITITVASFANVIPNIAAVLSVMWVLIRIAETKTVQKLLGKYSWIKENPNVDK